MVLAIKQALEQGTNFAIKTLGHRNGFYTSEAVPIEIPKQLDKVKKLLERIGQEQYMQRFELTLNRAAE